MWLRRNAKNLEYEALSITPCAVDLTGQWLAKDITSDHEVHAVVNLQQHGTAVFGRLQSKLASDMPIAFRGILIIDRLVANLWRPQDSNMGSGNAELVLSSDGFILEGTCTWFTPHNQEPQVTMWKWEKQKFAIR
jgi:hypothetical protein